MLMTLLKSKLPRSVRRHIRVMKSRIRKSTSDAAEQAKKIVDLYAKFGVVMD